MQIWSILLQEMKLNIEGGILVQGVTIKNIIIELQVETIDVRVGVFLNTMKG